jgi:hypothetical protein
MAAREAAKASTAETKNHQQEGPTGPPNAAEADALSDLFPGRQSCRLPSAVASVTLASRWRKKRAAMKPVIRYQSQLLPRRSYKPSRVSRIRPVKLRIIFRPVRFGIKPKITNYECESC